MEEPSQIILIRFVASRVQVCDSICFFAGKLRSENRRNLSRDLLLHRQQIGDTSLVLFTPQMLVVSQICKLDSDAQVISSNDHPSGNERSHLKLPTDDDWIGI